MRLESLLILFVLSSGLVVAAGLSSKGVGSMVSPSRDPGLKLSLNIPEDHLRLGEPLLLKLSTKNITKRSLSVTETSLETDYVFDVRDADGNQLPFTEYMKNRLANRNYILRFVVVKLGPGEENRHEVHLESLVKIDRPGTYSILVTRKVPVNPKNLGTLVDISSNRAIVVITDK